MEYTKETCLNIFMHLLRKATKYEMNKIQEDICSTLFVIFKRKLRILFLIKSCENSTLFITRQTRNILDSQEDVIKCHYVSCQFRVFVKDTRRTVQNGSAKMKKMINNNDLHYKVNQWKSYPNEQVKLKAAFMFVSIYGRMISSKRMKDYEEWKGEVMGSPLQSFSSF